MRRNNCGDDISKTQTARVEINTQILQLEYRYFFGDRPSDSLTNSDINYFIEYFIQKIRIRSGLCNINNSDFIREFVLNNLKCL